MDLPEVAIAPEEGKKGRTFRALHLASAVADALWPGGAAERKNDVARPVWATFLGSEAEMRSFAANLQLGRAALSGGGGRHDRRSGYEFLKSAGYRQTWQRHEGEHVPVARRPPGRPRKGTVWIRVDEQVSDAYRDAQPDVRREAREAAEGAFAGVVLSGTPRA